MTPNGNLNNDFRTCLNDLMVYGMEAHPRGTTTKELLNYNISLFDPRNRIINFPDRKTNLKYLLGELIWYFSGSNDPAGILPYSKFWDNIRNSGEHFASLDYKKGTINSNYGHRLFGHDEASNVPNFMRTFTPAGFNEAGELTSEPCEVSYIHGESQWNSTIALLTKDKDSRQAIMNIHRPSDRHEGNKDVPCTLSLQFFIRENKLHVIVNMRSNDIILGFTNDVFQFTMLQEAMLLELKKVYPELELGAYYHNAGSMHVYDRHFDMVNKIIADERSLELPMIAMDAFDDKILTGLVGVEAAWQSWLKSTPDHSELTFDFEQIPAFGLLTPYWKDLVLFCFANDHDAMHRIFNIPDHEHV